MRISTELQNFGGKCVHQRINQSVALFQLHVSKLETLDPSVSSN